MKWETIKRRVADDLCSRIVEGRIQQEAILVDLVGSDFAVLRNMSADERGRGFGALRQVYAAKVRECIDGWDIRAAERLRILFPGAFPKSLCKGALCAYINEKGDWVVELA
jgi:hypothetical protein